MSEKLLSEIMLDSLDPDIPKTEMTTSVYLRIVGRVRQLEAELERIICHWCEEGVTEAEANEHYKSCAKNPLRAENEALHIRIELLEDGACDCAACVALLTGVDDETE